MCLTTGSALQPQSQGGRRRCFRHPFGGWGVCSELFLKALLVQKGGGAANPLGRVEIGFPQTSQREKRMATRGSAELLGERSRFSRILAWRG